MATKSEIERLAVVETKVDQAARDIAEVKSVVKTEFVNLNKKVDDLDSKFAAKWVQQVVGGLIALILIAVITAILALVIIPATQNQSVNKTTVNESTDPSSPTSATRDTGSQSGSSSTSTSAKNQPSDKSNTDGGVQVTLPKVTSL